MLLLYAAYLNYLKLNRRTDTVCQRVKFLLQVLLPANVLNISLLGGFVWTVFFVAAVLTVPFATYYLFLTHWELNVIAWLLAGVFTTLTTLISLREIVAHLVRCCPGNKYNRGPLHHAVAVSSQRAAAFEHMTLTLLL